MSHRAKLKKTLKNTPVVGPTLLRLKAINSTPDYLRALDAQQTVLANQAKVQLELIEKLEKHISELSKQQAVLNQQIMQLKKAPGESAGGGSTQLFAEDHALDNFYLDFEDKFRGEEKVIEERLEVYVPRIKASGVDFKKNPLVDLGCGRGEMLTVMKKNDIRAIGVDLNVAMVEQSKALGFEAVHENAIDYIEKQPENSLGAITGFQFVEHIPFPELIRLFAACHKALVKGGFVIFETPNPENIRVAAWTYYTDPSHLNPIPPTLLEFALQTQGFGNTEIMRLHPVTEVPQDDKDDDLIKEMKARFFGPQDYSAIGVKL